jgi:hypothetical protein
MEKAEQELEMFIVRMQAPKIPAESFRWYILELSRAMLSAMREHQEMMKRLDTPAETGHGGEKGEL